MKWKLDQPSPGVKIDPNYKLLIGRLYDKLCEREYPFHESLPQATMPDEMAAYIIQHRFRKKEGGWPLIQMGPGIITLNDTENYDWPDYQKRLCDLINSYFSLYPSSKEIQVSGLTLRYIDAIDYDFNENILVFLKEKMAINFSMPESLFNDTNVNNIPLGIDFRVSYPFTQGVATVRIVRGKRQNKDAIITETVISSKKDAVPQSPEEIIQWIDTSHKLTHTWFDRIFKELMERFN